VSDPGARESIQHQKQSPAEEAELLKIVTENEGDAESGAFKQHTRKAVIGFSLCCLI